jgi:4a-hydroxytetrahydrobiopterin dehydratase
MSNPLLSELLSKHSHPIKAGAKGLGAAEIKKLLAALPGWKKSGGKISRTFSFENYYQTMAFVNAVAWIAHGEDHHPDLEVGYNRCVVSYSTHSVGGLSENDFICAAKVSGLIRGSDY